MKTSLLLGLGTNLAIPNFKVASDRDWLKLELLTVIAHLPLPIHWKKEWERNG